VTLNQQEGLVPLNKEFSTNLYHYISSIQTPPSHQKHKHGAGMKQFQTFAEQALTGSFEEKAAIFCGLKNSREISRADVSNVSGT
jgi:hypothetical protein